MLRASRDAGYGQQLRGLLWVIVEPGKNDGAGLKCQIIAVKTAVLAQFAEQTTRLSPRI